MKLYVRRILIKDEIADLMPNYLRFIRGLVDSNDLPVTVSRDTISQSKMFQVLTRKLVRKSIEMISKLANPDEDADDEETEDEITETEYTSDNEDTI